ncbi:hypothetical protein PGT21_021804 [Puccinia graminis f. sp. tritici]|uniref:Uncharacterized protein n=2 Tax=Puccinia graminis f. sp. tritici TaxID=56615 RepID=A0A5B0NR60_PUCGR|nr:hypothetical protein PGT21_021804 [Puccinia graminis f. sp. tritici]KAA1091721.1 hypothetical protein PGTUg99_004941 [Puccinia graminis f. sp. tritici]KAA1091722.1 hypothetical protein PGTUg99_004941 [Puccinia graminis f. sp. tritici]
MAGVCTRRGSSPSGFPWGNNILGAKGLRVLMKITMLFAALSAASGAFAAPAQAAAAAKDLSIGAGVGIGIGAGVGPYGYPYGAYPGWGGYNYYPYGGYPYSGYPYGYRYYQW